MRVLLAAWRAGPGRLWEWGTSSNVDDGGLSSPMAVAYSHPYILQLHNVVSAVRDCRPERAEDASLFRTTAEAEKKRIIHLYRKFGFVYYVDTAHSVAYSGRQHFWTHKHVCRPK